MVRASVAAVPACRSTRATVRWSPVRGLKSDSGSLSVRWSDEIAATCAIDYALPAVGASSAVYTEADALCR